MTSSVIKSVEDFVSVGEIKYEDRGGKEGIAILANNKPLLLSLGSATENSGFIVDKVPDQVKASSSGKSWEKDKLVLQLQRDSDERILQTVDAIARNCYEQARGPIGSKTWYGLVNYKTVKVKLHPTQTVYAQAGENPPDWKYIGSGNKYIPGNKRKREEPVEKVKNKKKGVVNVSDVTKEKTGSVDVKMLLQSVDKTQSGNQYKIHKGDQVCLAVEVGQIWTMNLDGQQSCGVTLRAKQILFLSASREPEDEMELPADLNMFN